jgi:LysR family transcriptional regulator, transcriptional activator of the cysJI operon
MKDRFRHLRQCSLNGSRPLDFQESQETDRVMIENFRIRVFRAVAQHLNFSRAAEELLLTQPAITQQIKALEDEFGVPLFDRGGGHVALTAGGKALLPFADRMKELSDEAFAAVAEAFGQHAGDLLPTFVAGFRRSNPKVRVTARSGNTDQMLEALLEREIQLALIEGPEQRKDLHLEPFMEDHMVLVVPATHGWANQEIKVEDLKSEPLLVREFGSGSRRVVEQALSKAGVKPKDLTISMELDSTEGLLSAVEAGLGITFVSRWVVRNQLSLGTLRIARVRGLKLSRRFSMAYPAGPEPTGTVGLFRRFLLSQAMEMASRRIARTNAS